MVQRSPYSTSAAAHFNIHVMSDWLPLLTAVSLACEWLYVDTGSGITSFGIHQVVVANVWRRDGSEKGSVISEVRPEVEEVWSERNEMPVDELRCSKFREPEVGAPEVEYRKLAHMIRNERNEHGWTRLLKIPGSGSELPELKTGSWLQSAPNLPIWPDLTVRLRIPTQHVIYLFI